MINFWVPPKPSYIYVLWTEALAYKIGISTNPPERLMALKTLSSSYFGRCAYTSWFWSPYANLWEGFLHGYFKPKQINTAAGREWFQLDTIDIDMFWSLPDEVPVLPYTPDYWRLLNAPDNIIAYATSVQEMAKQFRCRIEAMSIEAMELSIKNASSGRPSNDLSK